eukprot:scaffold80827_cov62-Attheya_sp.AAC.1
MAVDNRILVGPDDNPWTLALNWEKIRVYVVGDFISVCNLHAFIEKLLVQKRSSFDKKQKQI